MADEEATQQVGKKYESAPVVYLLPSAAAACSLSFIAGSEPAWV